MTLISQPIAIAIKKNPVQQTQVGKYMSFFPLFTLFLHLYKQPTSLSYTHFDFMSIRIKQK